MSTPEPAPAPPLSLLRADVGPAGLTPVAVLIGLAGVQNFDLVAFGVLAPSIRDDFGVSSGTITAVASISAALPIFLAVVVGYLGDARDRVRLSVASAAFWGVTAVLTGLAPLLSVLVAARVLGGVGLLAGETVYPSLLADYYPPRAHGRVFGAYRAGGQALALLGGPLAGLFGALLGWRAAFVLLALPTFVLAGVAARLLREPERGASQGLAGAGEAQGSILEGFRRVRAVPSLRRTWAAAFLFGGGTIPFVTILSNFFKDVYGAGDAARGLLTGLYGVGGLVGIVLGGLLTSRAVAAGRLDRLPVLNALMIGEFALGALVMALVPSYALAVVAATVLSVGGYGFLPAYSTLVAAVVPPRIRSQAYAWSLFFYALGAIVVSVVVGAVDDGRGPRVAIVVLSLVVAAGAVVNATVRSTLVADVERATRLVETTSGTALLSCRGVQAGYGGVQILFGVDFDVQEGEMVALLGTNGAGKSTFLKTITGLLDPTDGAISYDGRDITHAGPEACAALGIMAVPGGRGVFPTLSVADNLRAAGWMFRRDAAHVAAATEEVLERFPVLRTRWSTDAGDLSGGEQQMLSLSMAFLARPRLLLIDELSLGLAPVIVEQLVAILREIHATGTTIILVEQSVTTALDLAERAIFLEKGQVRFSGPTEELLERPDVMRAVFLSGQQLTTARDRVAPSRDVAPVLSAAGLVKRYGGVTAVNGVTFDLWPDEVLGFIGPNGAGKTSLFDLVSGFSRPDAGTLHLHGRDVTALDAVTRARAGLGRSFQDARLWPALTVAECLAVGVHEEGEIAGVLPALAGIPRLGDSEEAVHLQVDELVELMNLGAYRNKFISELSTGTRRMVELACLLGQRPSVLLLDEPSSGIAQRETEALGPVLRSVQAELGCAILVIEHDMGLITDLADRLVALELGTVVTDGAPADVLADPRVVAAYLGEKAQASAVAPRQRTPRTRPPGHRPARRKEPA